MRRAGHRSLVIEQILSLSPTNHLLTAPPGTPTAPRSRSAASPPCSARKGGARRRGPRARRPRRRPTTTHCRGRRRQCCRRGGRYSASCRRRRGEHSGSCVAGFGVCVCERMTQNELSSFFKQRKRERRTRARRSRVTWTHFLSTSVFFLL